MKRNFPVITLCGSTKFKDDFIRIQKDLTLKGYIVISVGLFGHSGDTEVWESMDEDTLTETKIMLDDMHKEKIDMADEIFVVNPTGYIGSSTWSEICYAAMLKKPIQSIVPINSYEIDEKVREHISIAREIAWQQEDTAIHQNALYPNGYPVETLVHFKHKKEIILDPWSRSDDPFEEYGNTNMAKFIEAIVTRREADVKADSTSISEYDDMKSEIEMYCKELDLEYPKGYPDNMTLDDMRKFIEVWSEYDPFPELN